ncbi:MAG TPA: hypothetical protein VGN11_12080 [Candidatus Baltobacteraceae bacterium]|jgi:hypothetical protein|nr:hypothetical protein [Candidatus Baltobacteraceae bacterium]
MTTMDTEAVYQPSPEDPKFMNLVEESTFSLVHLPAANEHEPPGDDDDKQAR